MIYDESTQKLKDFKTQASAQGFHVRIPKEKFTYEPAREISNSYFDHKPVAVAFPRNAKQIISCLEFCKENKLEVRLRSGGHQHEGMCSADGIFMIRLSDINLIQYEDDDGITSTNNPQKNYYITPDEVKNKKKAWIGVGCKLKAVYDELELYDRIIPGGGCWNVNVGGLTQGGGWGMNARKYGLTCDNILAAEIILANQQKVIATAENEYSDLFKAIRGGGGGNFGIVTRFLFKLQEVSFDLSRFSISWTDEKMEDLITEWLKMQATLTPDLTTFLRIQVDQPASSLDGKKYYPIRAGGLFHGTEADLRKIMKPFLEKFKDQEQPETKGPPEVVHFKVIRSLAGEKELDGSNSFDFDVSLADAFNYDTFDYSIGGLGASNASNSNQNKCKVTPPNSTCDAPHPHKVSSAFSNNRGVEYYKEIAKLVTSYYKKTCAKTKSEEVRSYMTFHTLGGKIKKEPNEGSGFAFRDREFLMQFQSWWNYPKKTDERKLCNDDLSWQQPYIDWVKNFRKHMVGQNKTVDGAFINFVDKDLGFDYNTKEGKYNLLKVYYKGKLDDLIEVKKKYDTDNVFTFKMSIPTEKP